MTGAESRAEGGPRILGVERPDDDGDGDQSGHDDRPPTDRAVERERRAARVPADTNTAKPTIPITGGLALKAWISAGERGQPRGLGEDHERQRSEVDEGRRPPPRRDRRIGAAGSGERAPRPSPRHRPMTRWPAVCHGPSSRALLAASPAARARAGVRGAVRPASHDEGLAARIARGGEGRRVGGRIAARHDDDGRSRPGQPGDPTQRHR